MRTQIEKFIIKMLFKHKLLQYMKNNWKQNLTEYGALHNKDCCVNFPEDIRACDVATEDDDCCENIKAISSFFKEEAGKIIEFISYDMNCKDEEQRKRVVEYYKNNFKIN